MSTILTDYDYHYPQELIAKYPKDKRDHSRLLCLNKSTGHSTHHDLFTKITEYFEEGDVLVFNNTKVLPCRLKTKRATGGKQEIFLIKEQKEKTWEVLVNSNKKVRKGDVFKFQDLSIEFINTPTENPRLVKLDYEGNLQKTLEKIAQVPLPPYMQREAEENDFKRYQTVYAKHIGSVAAPTAGLHFTDELIQKLKSKGVITTEVTLHVGLGTFLPVKTNDIKNHRMHHEFYQINQKACDIINHAKAIGKKVTAVGTTTTRILETLGTKSIYLKPEYGETNIFIYPPYEFKIIDRLITNFHQPKSTLLMMVSAFSSREMIFTAYEEAIKNNYRLFSYGDAMFIY